MNKLFRVFFLIAICLTIVTFDEHVRRASPRASTDAISGDVIKRILHYTESDTKSINANGIFQCYR